MNQQLQVFNHEQFGDVRIIEEDGRVLFCGKDMKIHGMRLDGIAGE